ncbi:MAG: aminotransferase class I/II-fold pyridoxal phosphate-dependent enzyme [Balneolales bacterium]
MRIETKSIHAGAKNDTDNRAVTAPIYPSTIYRHKDDSADPAGHVYTRASNPNRESLEELLTVLEQGKKAAAFASGMAASTAIFQALEPGVHVILPLDVYHGTRELLTGLMKRWNLDTSFVDMTDLDKVGSAIQHNTRLIWIETPSNPMLHITDIKKVCELASSRDITVCVDNTWSSPALQNPLDLGANLVMHSSTKYLSGHSDILSGAVVTKEENEIFENIRSIQQISGAVPSPQDCWLLQRSIKTLPYRMRGHCGNAGKIAVFLNDHPKVERVFYPGLQSHPGHLIAQSQMSDYGGMISFQIKGTGNDAMKITSSAKIITNATSLGGVESIWEQRVRSEAENTQTPANLIRLSVGLEHPDDLIEDIEVALNQV